ncbi:dihydrofolate reductase [Paenibacillus sp. HB172176]|uniref:dihydrofolate reductase n=1 Tax=Paenibacillus sp. HB172176 TaxID=2493690 RepID=UPI00143A0CD1|nr:dihydrofolate reductase [Paenibacillus sp. HB172176]
MSVTLIAAMDNNRLLGKDNKMPWHLPAEMAYFKEKTIGKTVLMGRKTFESLGGRPLPNRRNVVLTRQSGLKLQGCEIVHSPEDAVKQYGSAQDELMVIGGAEVYGLLLPFADKLLLTDINVDLGEGDAYFPLFPREDWQLADSRFRASDEKNKYDFTLQTYVRKT